MPGSSTVTVAEVEPAGAVATCVPSDFSVTAKVVASLAESEDQVMSTEPSLCAFAAAVPDAGASLVGREGGGVLVE
jgi:hypothetical protein